MENMNRNSAIANGTERNPEVKSFNNDERVAHHRNPKYAKPAQASYSAISKADIAFVNANENVGKVTYGDLEALFGTAAARRLELARKTNSQSEPATFDCEGEVRNNLICVLLRKGIKLSTGDGAAIESGDYEKLKSGALSKPYALEDILLAERYEYQIRGKRNRQIKRGAQAFHEDDTRDKLAGAAAVAYAAALIAKTAIAVKKIIKG